SVFLFFFFQAEDGIRDFHVTGVQTCALPICTFRSKRALEDRDATGLVDRVVERTHHATVDGGGLQLRHVLSERLAGHGEHVTMRSEERRVGKECRSRWWPEH